MGDDVADSQAQDSAAQDSAAQDSAAQDRAVHEPRQNRLYFRQLLSGRDFATSDPIARQMVNFCYLIGDRETREAVIVDPAYAVDDLLDVLDEDDMTLAGVLATHFHADHVGGNMMGYSIEGVAQLLERQGTKIHLQAAEAELVRKTTGISTSDMALHASGDVVSVGAIDIELLHTPGHTPGSQCFLVGGALVAGDTLFLEGCGRMDLPGSDPTAMYRSLHDTLAKVPDSAVLFPGHQYSADPYATMGETRQLNYVFKPRSEAQWLMMFGHV